jgi:hypothetical protein
MFGPAVRRVVESMNGARFLRDQLEEHGSDVLIADATRSGPWPLACKTEKIEDRMLAQLSGAGAREWPGRGSLAGSAVYVRARRVSAAEMTSGSWLAATTVVPSRAASRSKRITRRPVTRSR